jgi:macrolide transport system ATP-binding/permease protein
MLEVAAPPTSYGKDEQAVALGRQIISRIASLPGVQSVAITTRQLPVSFNGNTDWIRFVGRPYNGQHNEVNERDVSSAYFTTLQARLLRGRYFTDAEDASKPSVAIINQALARKYFPGGDPIGQKIGDTQLSPKSLKQIVGVVDDVREGPLDAEIWPTEYLPFNQTPETYIGIAVRTAQAPELVLPMLQTALHQIDPDVGTVNEMTMTERINDSQTSYLHRSVMWLVGGFAALALLLGVVGLYGVIAYSVSQRTREIGIRMALGAQRRDVMRHVVRQGGSLTGVGLVVGVIAALALTRFLTSLLYGVKPADPATFTAVSAILTAVALLASYIPARRATKVNPMVALRHE